FGSFRREVVVGFFELRVGVGRLAAVRILDYRRLLLVLLQIFELALLGGRAACGLDIVCQCIHIGAAIGEDVLHRQDFRAQSAELIGDFLRACGRLLIGALVILFQLLVIAITLDIFFRLRRGGTSRLQKRGVAILPFALVSL